MARDVLLVVQADDFGLCHAVNQGVVKAYREGIVRQATVMVPAPWFSEAARLAKSYDLTCGIHLTLTCEWKNLRWRPLTAGSSLRDEFGMFHSSAVSVAAHADEKEAVAELEAQTEAFLQAGLKPAFCDLHMNPISTSAHKHVSRTWGPPLLYDIDENPFRFDTLTHLGSREEATPAWLIEHLHRLQPGRHLLITHPAIASDELASMTTEDAHDYAWASKRRVDDLRTLTDSAVRETVERLGITLCSVDELDGYSV